MTSHCMAVPFGLVTVMVIVVFEVVMLVIPDWMSFGLTLTECELVAATDGTTAGMVIPTRIAAKMIAPTRIPRFLVIVFFTSLEYTKAKRIELLLETSFQQATRPGSRPFGRWGMPAHPPQDASCLTGPKRIGA